MHVMTTPNPLLSTLSRALAALAAGMALAPMAPARAAETLPLVTTAPLLDFAERSFPALFPPGSSHAGASYAEAWHDYVNFQFRYYPATGNYLAVASGMVYGLGPFTGGQLVSFGPVSAYHCAALPAACTLTPRPTFNECHVPAVAALPIGLRTEATYRYSGTLVGQSSVSTLIEGPAASGGPTARSVVTVNNGRFTLNGVGYEWDATTREVRVPSAEGIVFTLEQNSDVTERLAATGLSPATQERTVNQVSYQPGLPETQFTLQPGGFVSQTVKRTTGPAPTAPRSRTGRNPVVRDPVAGYYQENHRFIGIETLQVGGRAMRACRYEVSKTDDNYEQWVLVGSGLTARFEYKTRSFTGTVELLSASINGQPL